ncbi:MAG: pyruvate kinase [Spirochaetaceae bacterium]|nr:pyruvate kinase [Spirochaetaceae bacterium]
MHPSIRNTRIICSIGPAVGTDELVRSLIKKGMNLARFNLSHDTHEFHAGNIARVKKISKEEGVPIALILDTKGPEIRTGLIRNDAKIAFAKDDLVDVVAESDAIKLYGDDGAFTEKTRVTVNYDQLADDIIPNVKILIADGLLALMVLSVEGRVIKCKVVNNAEIGSKKNVNVIGVKTKLPALTEKDKVDLLFGHQQDLDYIAASFVRKASDVITIQKYLSEIGSNMPVIAKIEDEEGLNNIEEIIRVAAGIMVARGDLGVQIPAERVPLEQKRIIRLCNAAGKPVITATQMLDSMIRNPTPTRAEAGDVANAIFDGTDCIMLSGETSSGSYPEAAVTVMESIARAVESSDEYLKHLYERRREKGAGIDLTHTISNAASWVADKIEAACIIAPTLSGNTAKLISRYRPRRPIIAASPSEVVRRRLLLYWGIIPVAIEQQEDSEAMIQSAITQAIQKGFAASLDKVIVVSGIPIRSPLATNNIRVHVIGNVLGKGGEGFGKHCTGRIVKVNNFQEAAAALMVKKESKILVTHNFDSSFTPILPIIDGIILEGASEVSQEYMQKVNHDIVVLSYVPNAMSQFGENITVTLDGTEKLIYEGSL